MQKDKIFKSINIWKNKSAHEAVCFRCFQCLDSRQYYVQSKDYLRLPIEEEQVANLNNQFLELFIESPPNLRTEGFNTIEEAISKYEEEFENIVDSV